MKEIDEKTKKLADILMQKGEYKEAVELNPELEEEMWWNLAMDAIERKDVVQAIKSYKKLLVITGGGPNIEDLADQIELLNSSKEMPADKIQTDYLNKLRKLQNSPIEHQNLFEKFVRQFNSQPWICEFILDYLKSLKRPDLSEAVTPWTVVINTFYRQYEYQLPFTKEQTREAAKIVFLVFGEDPNKAMSCPDRKEAYTDRYFNWAKDILKS